MNKDKYIKKYGEDRYNKKQAKQKDRIKGKR